MAKAFDFNNLFLPPPKGRLRGATPAQIRAAERALGVTFPPEFTAMLRAVDGGRLRYNGLVPVELPPISHTSRKIYEIESLPGLRPPWGLVEDAANAHQEWELHPRLIPIEGDGHWFLCLDYRRCGPRGRPRVVHIESDSKEESLVAKSFGDFLAGLVRASEQYIFAITDPKLDSRALDRIVRSLGARRERAAVTSRWDWPPYLLAYTKSPASLRTSTDQDRQFPQLKRNAVLLTLDVRPEDASTCVRKLAAALGSRAQLIHQPLDQPPVSFKDLDKVDLTPAKAPKAPPFTEVDALDAILRGSPRKVLRFIRLGLRPNAPLTSPETPIDLAARHGRAGTLTVLLKHAKGRINSRDAFSNAIDHGAAGCLKVMLAAGLKPTSSHLADAILKGFIPSIKLLLKAGLRPTAEMIRINVAIPCEGGGDQAWFERETRAAEALRAFLLKAMHAK
ncbi:MAG: SMI1/KNR4 family protein [Planctomycetota bacterium]